jgi:SAM-dependent methyltransferase/WD40 repeat protein
VEKPSELLWTYKCGGAIISIHATPNCSLIVAGSVDSKIRLLDWTGKLLWEKQLDNEVWAVQISESGNYIIAGTANKDPSEGQVYVFDRKGSEIFNHDIKAPVWSVSISEDGEIISASSWNNSLYVFHRSFKEYKGLKSRHLGDFGLYGTKLSKNGQKCFVAAYDSGVFVLDENLTTVKKIKSQLKTGLYNIWLCEELDSFLAGSREGAFIIISLKDDSIKSFKVALRPICGISSSQDMRCIACGSFDGNIYLCSSNGDILWSFQTTGEVWSTSISSDGKYVCAGSGDENIYFIQNHCSSGAIKELNTMENLLLHTTGHDLRDGIQKLSTLYIRYGLLGYGQNQIHRLGSSKLNDGDIKHLTAKFLRNFLSVHSTNCYAHYYLGKYLKERGKNIVAIKHFQTAAHEKELQSTSFSLAGQAFLDAGFPSAAKSCFKRSTVNTIRYREMNIIYNLARSYEDERRYTEAQELYQVIVSFDISFRNAQERLQILQNTKRKNDKVDYTGVTVNLLGVDAPRATNIDKLLNPIYKSRLKELAVDSTEHQNIIDALEHWPYQKDIPIHNQDDQGLFYDEQVYLKYDYPPPEDEIKKHVELLYELSLIQPRMTNIHDSLDIGSATGRHPTMLSKLGVKAVGIDVEAKAIEYAEKVKKAKLPNQEYPKFSVADAQNIPFTDNSFDLVTCMMGTFAHFLPENRSNILKEIGRVMKPSGILLISTWDPECSHLSFLSIYTDSVKQLIRNNLLSKHQLSLLLEQNNLRVKKIIPFILFPHSFIYELDLEKMKVNDVKRFVEMDLAVRSYYPETNGEMFMLLAEHI